MKISNLALLLFALVTGCKGKPQESANYTPTSILFSSSGCFRPSISNYNFRDRKDRIVLKIDEDGDVFLRGKWMGSDYRLSNKY